MWPCCLIYTFECAAGVKSAGPQYSTVDTEGVFQKVKFKRASGHPLEIQTKYIVSIQRLRADSARSSGLVTNRITVGTDR